MGGRPAQPPAEDDPIEIAAEDRPPFTQLGDWVALAPISPQAKVLYWCLAMHINQGRAASGDTQVWPSRTTLAAMLGFKKPANIDRYMQELVDLRAVTVHRRAVGGMRVRNRYTVRITPPAGSTKSASLADFYKAQENSVSAGQDVAPQKGLRLTRENSVFAGGAVVPCEGLRSPSQGTHVVPHRGLELEEVELEEEPPPPAFSTEAGASAGRRIEEEEGASREPTTRTAAAVVDAVSWPAGKPRPTVDDRRRLVDAAGRCLSAGHAPDDVRRELAASGSARSPVGAGLARLRRMASTEPRPVSPAGPPGAEPARHRRRERHPFVEGGAYGACRDCGRPSLDEVAHPPLPVARRCEHGRVAVICPSCSQDAA